MDGFEVRKLSDCTQIKFSPEKDKKQDKIALILVGLIFLCFLLATIYSWCTHNVSNGTVFMMLALAFFVLFVLMANEKKQRNTYILKVDADGFHESSVSFVQKDMKWNEVCYIDYLPNFIVHGGKAPQAYTVLVVSKTEMEKEKRIKFLKRKKWGNSFEKSALPNEIVIISSYMQISRIYQLIAKQAVLHGCEHALQKEVEDD